jgi:predicted MFS family arabinose efflux permease
LPWRTPQTAAVGDGASVMTRRAVIALGLAQCINWGVLYYAFSVLVVPVSKDLDVSLWVVTGAFSLALLVSALLSPVIGSWIDRGHGPSMMRGGGWAAVALLLLWTVLPGVTPLYAVWIGLGACMATTLYEPAFAIVARAHVDPVRRLRALALVTVFGGVASTVFLPSTDLLMRAVGWRSAVVVLALAVALSTELTQTLVFSELALEPLDPRPLREAPPSGVDDEAEGMFAWAVLTFAFASFASAGLTANLVPALAERHVSPATTALLGGAFGAMQLPGRLLLSAGALRSSPVRLIVVSLLLQACGLVGVTLAPSVGWVAAALMVFACGAGLATLARPHFTQACFGVHRSGYLNGRLARWQQLARAVGPISAAAVAATIGYGAVVAVLGLIFAALATASYRLLDRRTTALEAP